MADGRNWLDCGPGEERARVHSSELQAQRNRRSKDERRPRLRAKPIATEAKEGAMMDKIRRTILTTGAAANCDGCGARVFAQQTDQAELPWAISKKARFRIHFEEAGSGSHCC